MSGSDLPRGYETVRVLGAGGYGEVVLARQVSLDRLVAVKRIHAYLLSGPDDQARFRREAQVLAALDAPTVVRVHDFINEGSAAFLVMEHVPGRTLGDLLEDGGLPPARALGVLRDVADALRVADARGVVHRDVKPGNVFVLPDGRAKLGDFGLARVVADPAVFRTTDGSVSGTPAYFAPESGLDEPDIRSDAYSFGAMAFEVLTGRLPFDMDDTVQLLAAHLSSPPPAADLLVPGFPPAAARALEAALSKRPTDRPLPWELVETLGSVPVSEWPGGGLSPAPARVGAAPETIRSPRASSPQAVPALPSARRQRPRLAAVLATGAVLVAVTVASLLSRPDAPQDAERPAPVTVKALAVGTEPADGMGSCPLATYEFTGVVEIAGGEGPLEVAWTRPDGRDTTATVLDVAPGQQRATAVLTFQVTGELPLDGAAVFRVVSPQQLTASSGPIRYGC